MDNVVFDESELKTEIFIPEEPKTTAEYIAMLSNPAIRVTYLATGVSAIGEGQGSQIKNKEKAIELLRAQLEKDESLRE
jgi:protein subunit release factor A